MNEPIEKEVTVGKKEKMNIKKERKKNDKGEIEIKVK